MSVIIWLNGLYWTSGGCCFTVVMLKKQTWRAIAFKDDFIIIGKQVFFILAFSYAIVWWVRFNTEFSGMLFI